jgi:hypothetical protein
MILHQDRRVIRAPKRASSFSEGNGRNAKRTEPLTTCVLCGILIFGLFGCARDRCNQALFEPPLIFGVEDPPLLPPKNGHPVEIAERNPVSAGLSAHDLAEIVNLVGRVPKLLKYRVELITRLDATTVEVFVPGRKIICHRGKEWKVQKIMPLAY